MRTESLGFRAQMHDSATADNSLRGHYRAGRSFHAMRSHPAVLAAVTGLVTLAVLTGCSVNVPGSTTTDSRPSAGASGSPSAAASAPSKPGSHQKPLTAVPTTCPDPDAITLSVKIPLPSVDTNPLDTDKLECTYYNASDASKALVMTFGPSDGATPAQFSQQILAAQPTAVAVHGVGDAAYFFTYTDSTGTIGAMNYLSGAVFGYVYGYVDYASQAHLSALIADQILVP